MWRIWRIVIALALAFQMQIFLDKPNVALGATTADVTVTATPVFGGSGGDAPPTYLSATYVNKSQVRLTWGVGSGATRTMIRAKYNGYPEDIADGYLVYEAGGATTEDASINFDEYLGTVYYRAWSGNVTDWNTSGYAQDELENPLVADLVEQLNHLLELVFMALPVLAVLGFSGFAFWKPNPVLFMYAAGASIVTGLYLPDSLVNYAPGLGITIGLMFIGYSFLCIAYAYRMLFWNEERDE